MIANETFRIEGLDRQIDQFMVEVHKKYSIPVACLVFVLIGVVEKRLCGKCSMDGYRTCVDGPCFTLDELEETTSFGRYHRGPSGQIQGPGHVNDGSADAGASCCLGCEG